MKVKIIPTVVVQPPPMVEITMTQADAVLLKLISNRNRSVPELLQRTSDISTQEADEMDRMLMVLGAALKAVEITTR